MFVGIPKCNLLLAQARPRMIQHLSSISLLVSCSTIKYLTVDYYVSCVSRNGYKMCIRAYLNGDGSGYNTHLSVFFVLMKGEYDALLRWPFDYKVSMILVGKEGG